MNNNYNVNQVNNNAGMQYSNQQSQVMMQQVPVNMNNQSNMADDLELLKLFIGEKYNKFINSTFNVPAMFFTFLYYFYRKMFLYGILFFIANFLIINLIKVPLMSLGISILAGFFTNKVYLFYAKNKVAKIKKDNPNVTFGELKMLCSKKGGTSIGLLLLGIFIEILVVVVSIIVVLVTGIGTFFGEMFGTGDTDIVDIDNNVSDTDEEILVQSAKYQDCICYGEDCTVTFGGIKYEYSSPEYEVFLLHVGYYEHLNFNIYYKVIKGTKTIVRYEVFDKSTNEDVTNLKTEEALRAKLGFYTLGKHTAKLKLVEIGSIGSVFGESKNYPFRALTFVDPKTNIEYDMKYDISVRDIAGQLTVGKEYNVSFLVEEGIVDYDYLISKING